MYYCVNTVERMKGGSKPRDVDQVRIRQPVSRLSRTLRHRLSIAVQLIAYARSLKMGWPAPDQGGGVGAGLAETSQKLSGI